MRRIRHLPSLLAAGLVAAAASAHADESSSLLSERLLEAYRTEPICDGGRAYEDIRSSLRVEAGAARSARFLGRPDTLPLEQRIAADYDRVAGIAVARGCPEIARTFWRYILDDYTSPDHATIRQRAEQGLRGLGTSAAPPAR